MNIPKLLIFSILLFFCCSAVNSNAQVTSNVLMRVLKIHSGKQTGTAFTMDVDGRQYLITAKHMVAGLKKEDSIDIYKNNQWVSTTVKVLRCEEPIDIAVLIPSKLLTVSYPLDPISSSQNIFLGQDIYFLGFPYGTISDVNIENLDGNYPLPSIKKGIFMATEKEGEALRLRLDGFNNPGFSGGPIVFRDIMHPTELKYYVAGVISGFVPEYLPVFTPVEIKAGDDISNVEQWRIMQLPNGKKAILRDTQQFVVSNTGIVIGYGIKHAIDLIRKNPLGPEIAK